MTSRMVAAGLLVLFAAGSPVPAQEMAAIDPEALIDRILAVRQQQRDVLEDVVFDAELVEKDDDGKEKKRFVKKLYLKYLPDTTWFAEEYLEYYKDGKLQSEQDRDKEVSDRIKKAQKRKARNISYPLLTPFLPENRDQYEILYEGVAKEKIGEYVCHYFKVLSKEKVEDNVNGDFYFEAESFHLVRADISPARLVKKAMFKLNELTISTLVGPAGNGVWLPRQADVQGKGKAALFMGVKFSSTEYYRNPVVNSGLADKIFEVDNDE
ncbi:MAG: hypothetical protein OEW00_00950 [candidate division Zixibacteria bacterium]|nr:hypothetical protein [candidate division Zixibacteria bacterium]